MTPKRKWTLAICGLLAFNVAAMTALAVAANNGGTQIIPAYDVKAAHYSDEMARVEASRKLGWRAEPVIASGALEIALVDGDGAPVVGATVTATGYQRAHAAERFELALTPIGPGRYRAALRERTGWHDLVITAERGAAQFLQRAAIEAK